MASCPDARRRRGPREPFRLVDGSATGQRPCGAVETPQPHRDRADAQRGRQLPTGFLVLTMAMTRLVSRASSSIMLESTARSDSSIAISSGW
jgi:hypothetical protein